MHRPGFVMEQPSLFICVMYKSIFVMYKPSLHICVMYAPVFVMKQPSMNLCLSESLKMASLTVKSEPVWTMSSGILRSVLFGMCIYLDTTVQRVEHI